ncbi:hypothetical protein GOP47_0004720 [Adiantum capillus-veneris]|uniref:TF-B3 domain-containing protein n=1 Tax=Adiantum capillus-veneris TaxID=13818 RepID=A0A9D4ZMY8_ADICA|nr:hypothetical protein GOP47_0004720 [Adiantum capillus-veneris]
MSTHSITNFPSEKPNSLADLSRPQFFLATSDFALQVAFKMEFWHTHPTESDLHFAQTINPTKPVEAAQDSLLEAKSLPVPTKFLPDIASDHVNFEVLPQTKKVKTENPLSPRCSMYGGWLEGLRQIAKNLPSGQENSNNARLPELLNYVMVQLEHKLAVDDFKTQSSECSFWASIQDMAKKCGIDFCEFEKLCCSPGFKDVTFASDSGIPRLVDPGNDLPLCEFVGCSLAGYSNMSSGDVFQPYPLGTARDIPYTTPNSASFEQLPLHKLQRQVTFPAIVKHPEQGSLCTPGSPYSALSISKATTLQNSSTSVVSMNNIAPLEKQSSQCQSVLLTPQPLLLATVPEACRRRIQRQRKRAMNYNHLSTNFGASTSSLAWNTNIVGASDLQFLLEKELKPSDVGSLGRIILPKRQAEEKLPRLDTKEGLKIPFQDLQTSQIWELRFRFWPNNKTRMYLLESTGNFVKSHHLREGDFVVLYRNPATGIYMINGKKAAWPKCLSMSERRSLPPCSETVESDKASLGPAEKESVSDDMRQLIGTEDERNSSNNGDTDLLASDIDIWDMEDPGELIKGFTDIGADERSLDDIFDFKE